MRGRAQRDREEYVKYAAESLLKDLVPVLDNLDRALAAARAGDAAAGVVEGVELIHRELLRVLERAGVTRYSAVGQRFDPTRHEAVTVYEAGPGGLNRHGIASACSACTSVFSDATASASAAVARRIVNF